MPSQVSDDSPEPSNQASREAEAQHAADKYLFLLLRQHARALQKMALFECTGAIAEIDGFGEQLKQSPWALSLVGRAYYEMVDYRKVLHSIVHAYFITKLPF